MRVYKVRKEDAKVSQGELEERPSLIEDYVKLANGIVFGCQEYGDYSQGSRNTIAVDLTVACYMLGLDVMDVVEHLLYEEVINEGDDDEYVRDRFERVLGYRYAFDWDWMIDPDQFVDYTSYGSYDEGALSVRVELVD